MKILVIGDLHFPFNHKAAMSWVFDTFIKPKSLRPDVVVQIGDLYDLYSMSKFPKNPNLYTPYEEIAEARECATELWGYIRSKLKKAKLIQIFLYDPKTDRKEQIWADIDGVPFKLDSGTPEF